MSTLFELVRMVSITPTQLLDALETLVDRNGDFGMADAGQVIGLFGKCTPALTSVQFGRIRDICRTGARQLQGTGRGNAVQDFGRVAEAAAERA